MGPIQPNPGQKETHFGELLVSGLIMLALITLSFIAGYTLYSTGQERIALVAQRQQQQLNQLYWHKYAQAERSADEGNYLACTQILAKVPADSNFYPQVQHLAERCYAPLYEGWLTKARELAAAGRLGDAIAQASKITGSSLQMQAQELIAIWSQRMIELAKQHYAAPDDHFNQAVTIISAVPEGSPLYATSQKLLQQWQQEWSDNRRYYQSAQSALETGDLAGATQAAGKISFHSVWAPKREHILSTAEKSEQRFNQLAQEIDRLIDKNELRSAAQLIQQLPDTGPWHSKKLEASEEINAIKHQKKWLLVTIPIAVMLFALGNFKRVT